MIYLPPSAWNMTPSQRLARLHQYVKLVTGRKGQATLQLKRYLEEIEELTKANDARLDITQP